MGSDLCTIKAIIVIVVPKINKAGRVNSPIISNIEQKNSAKTAKNKELGSPNPIGSANDQSPEIIFINFSYPCVNMNKEENTLKKNTEKSIDTGMLDLFFTI